jgi:hypothetical protein
MKKLAIALLLLLVVVAASLSWLRGNLDGLVKNAIEKYGSEMTQAKVTVDAVEINAADGRGVIRGLTIGNPAGFHTSHALKVGAIEVGIDLGSVTGNVVTVNQIAITAPDVIYEKGEAMTNFDAIEKNIAAYVGPSKKDSGGKKLIVVDFVLRDAKAEASAAFMKDKTIAVPLPDIRLHDLGKAKGGVTPGELGQEIAGAIKQKLAASVSFDRLMKSTAQGVENAGKALRGLLGK